MVVLPLVAPSPGKTPEVLLEPVGAVMHLLTGGVSGAPAPTETAPELLCELAGALADLSSLARRRTLVRMRVERFAWELALERCGPDVFITLFQGGALPEVMLHEHRVNGDAMAERVLRALHAAAGAPVSGEQPSAANDAGDPDDAEEPSDYAAAVPIACDRLAASLPFQIDRQPSEMAAVSIDPTGEVSVVLGADVMLRTPSPATLPSAVLRADLHALLFRGRLRITLGEHTRELPDVFVFLVAEQLVFMAMDAIDAMTQARAFHRRVPVGGAICGVRINPRGAASLTLGVRRRGGEDRADTSTFPAVDLGALAQGILAFGRALARSLVRRDRAQAYNLRLVDFRAKLRELSERIRETLRNDSKVNASPESYRAFAQSARPARGPAESFGHARLRYTPKWLATVPSIDLRATFLCGDALLVGSTRDTCCFDRRSGDLVWRRPMPRGVSVMTPAGLARLEPDGTLSVHEVNSGEIAWTAKLAPRVGATASGTVVSAPGLPRLLLISEGERKLAAVDLDTGEIRWRHASRRGATFRVRRAGKLAIVVSGEPVLTAVDILTGEVVWRYCDRLRFAAHVAVDHDALFAVAGGGALVGRGGARLVAIDPWSGSARQAVPLPAGVAPVGAPLLASETVIVVTHGRAGTGLAAFDRRTLELRFQRIACAAAASCMIVDDAVVINSEGGELVAIDARDGSTRYRHVFSCAEGDKPRRLEPVLRSGALFVPQDEVHVVRPRDGALLGKVATDLIPDLLRVDERCDVYVVEESGHLAAFAAAPRLALVQ